MNTIKQAYSVFKVIFKDTYNKSFDGFSKKKDNKEIELDYKQKKLAINKKAGKIGLGILMSIGILAILFYLCVYAAMLTESSIKVGIFEAQIYTFIAATQLAVVFLGSIVVLNYLYFSKDNYLLASLPISSRAVFLAKYTMAYLSELIITLFISLPLIITSGIYASVVCGYNIGAAYYIIGILGAFLIPILPLLLITLISLPLMYLVSFFKKRALSNAIVVVVVMIFGMIIYFAFISGMVDVSGNVDESGNPTISSGIISAFLTIKKLTIFNYLIVNAMLGVHSVGYFFAHLASLMIVLLISVLLSSIFYRKGTSILLEGSSANVSKKAKKAVVFAKGNFLKSYIKKEIKSILASPSLFSGAIMGIVMIPVFGIFFGKGFSMPSETGISQASGDLYMISMVLYMSSIMLAASNTISMVGFSMEGKNILLLKTLPIGIKDIILPKIIVCFFFNILVALSGSITIIGFSSQHNVLVGLATFVVLLVGSVGTTCSGLYNDIKNPKFDYKNLSELTKNNKRAIKPVLTNIAIGMIYLIMGISFASISDQILKPIFKYLILYGTMAIVTSFYAFLSYKKLVDKAELTYETLEV